MKMLGILIVLLLCGGCTDSGRPAPVDIVLDEDGCTECRMAVSQLPFAAEAVRPGGLADYFDDIGCLIVFAQQGKVKEGSALYVVDFESGEWLDAETAVFLQAESFPTPMSYGLGAFGTEAAAKAALERWPGRVTSWSTLLEEFNP